MHKNELYVGWSQPFVNLAANNSEDENLREDCKSGCAYRAFAKRVCPGGWHAQDVEPSGIIRHSLLAYLQGCEAIVGPKGKGRVEGLVAAAQETYPEYRVWSKKMYAEHIGGWSDSATPVLSLVTPENAGYVFIMNQLAMFLADVSESAKRELASKRAEVEVVHDCSLKVKCRAVQMPAVIKLVTELYDGFEQSYCLGNGVELKRRYHIVEAGDALAPRIFDDMMDARVVRELAEVY